MHESATIPSSVMNSKARLSLSLSNVEAVQKRRTKKDSASVVQPESTYVGVTGVRANSRTENSVPPPSSIPPPPTGSIGGLSSGRRLWTEWGTEGDLERRLVVVNKGFLGLQAFVQISTWANSSGGEKS